MIKSIGHPLDPLSSTEVRRATHVLREHLSVSTEQIRFKIVDLVEPPKSEVLKYLDIKTPKATPIDRKARIYYHARGSQLLGKALVNITTGIVEQNDELPDVQGPADWVEYALVHDACNSHPAVLAEVDKLKLPLGSVTPWLHKAIP